MKVKELKKWLDLYDENLVFKCKFGGAAFEPTVLEQHGDNLVFGCPYGKDDPIDAAAENIKNVIIAQGGKCQNSKREVI